MGNCCEGPKCEAPEKQAATQGACPRCGMVGRVVGDETVRAMVKPSIATTLLALERRFCRTPTCDVLYYGADGRVVEKNKARVRVGVKETDDPVALCYCFNFSRADVRLEVAETGSCGIPARITAEVRAGRCACEVKNPSGACCLGEVNKAVKDAQDALGKGREQRPTVPSPPRAAKVRTMDALLRDPCCLVGLERRRSNRRRRRSYGTGNGGSVSEKTAIDPGGWRRTDGHTPRDVGRRGARVRQ